MRRILMASAIASLLVSPAFAHCDSMDGPVVHDAQRAIEAQDVTPVLKWVTAADEDEIRAAFDMTLAVRGESDTAMQVADRYFYETLIRVHRASEGEGFTGLKPARSVVIRHRSRRQERCADGNSSRTPRNWRRGFGTASRSASGWLTRSARRRRTPSSRAANTLKPTCSSPISRNRWMF